MSFFDLKKQEKSYKILLIMSIIFCLFSIWYVIVRFHAFTGIRTLVLPLMPFIFGYLSYFYYARLKQIKNK